MVNEAKVFNSLWAQNDIMLEDNLNQYFKNLITNNYGFLIRFIWKKSFKYIQSTTNKCRL